LSRQDFCQDCQDEWRLFECENNEKSQKAEKSQQEICKNPLLNGDQNKLLRNWGNPWSRGRTSDSQLGDSGSIPARSK
jgi:hypothetical protein